MVVLGVREEKRKEKNRVSRFQRRRCWVRYKIWYHVAMKEESAMLNKLLMPFALTVQEKNAVV